MKYLKKILIDINQINLIINENIIFKNIEIAKLYLKINKQKEDYLITYSNTVIKVKNFDFKDIILKINNPFLYFNYYKNVLKKPFEDCRDIISDELIDSALSSIESEDSLALSYNELTGKTFGPKTEKRFLNKLEEKLLDLEDELSDGFIYTSYEIGNSDVYDYIKYFKEKNVKFEKILLDYSNKNGGLKITGIPYEEGNNFLQYRTILDEVIYNYTITNRDGVWPEIGINNREDLLKLRTQIVDHGLLNFELRGYGELDY